MAPFPVLTENQFECGQTGTKKESDGCRISGSLDKTRRRHKEGSWIG